MYSDDMTLFIAYHLE